MGPQHPSTHGVLRLILEIDGETVTEARCGIGYLHTGIEKNMEFRNWTQGVTFCTRMDYLSPLYQEAAYCLGVERLLGITDDVPERANVIRVLLMELNRVSSHIVALATGGMEIGALTVMTVGFRMRERVLKLLRAHHRPADEPRVHPPRRPRAGPPARRARRARRRPARHAARTSPTSRSSRTRTRWCAARLVDVGYLDLTGCMALGITGPVLRATGLPHDLRKSQPYCGYENYEFDVVTWDTCDAYGRLRIRIEEMRQSLRIVEQCARAAAGHRRPARSWSATGRSPGRRSSPSAATAWATASTTSARSWAQSMEALIHHFKLVTEGFRVPAGQVYPAVESPRGELGAHLVSRRRHPALPGALPRPVVRQPAGRGGDVRGRPDRRRHRRRGLARPRDGWSRPLMPRRLDPTGAPRAPARPADAERRSSRATRVPRSALLPMLHLVQSEEGYVSPDGIAFCAEQLGLTTAEVAAVATFYTQYKRHPNGDVHRRGLHEHPVRGAWAATRSSRRWRSTSASATTRRPPTARSRSSGSSATRPATTRPW